MSFDIVVDTSTNYVVGVGPFAEGEDFGEPYLIITVEDDSLYDTILDGPYTQYDPTKGPKILTRAERPA